MADGDEIDKAEADRAVKLRGAVENAIDNMAAKLNSGEFKMTIAEFARLLELQKDLAAGSVRHVKVTWVEPSEKTESVS